MAFGLIVAAAASAALFAVLTLLQIPQNIDQQRAAGTFHGVSDADLSRTVITVSVGIAAVGLAYAGVLLIFAFRLRSGRRRARIAVVVLTVLSVLPLNAPALLVTLVLVAADVLMFRRSVTSWLDRDGPALG